jgi:transcriptional regulator with XRE-family HTH domain
MGAGPDEPTDIRVRIGQRIAAARTELGYSQAELARALSAAGAPTISPQQVSRWERGKQMPKPENFAILERVLGKLLC